VPYLFGLSGPSISPIIEQIPWPNRRSQTAISALRKSMSLDVF